MKRVVAATVFATLLAGGLTFFHPSAAASSRSRDAVVPDGSAVTFSGVVQDQHGNPQVNGGTVELYHKGHPGGYTDALDENGAFSLTVAAGSYDFLLDLDASSGSWAGTIDLSASKHQDLAVPMYALRVDVADSDGAPVSNAAVALIDGCNESSVELFPGFTAIGSYANARGSTNASGEITLTIPPCSSALTFQVTPAKGSGFAGTTFQIDNVTGNQTVDVVLPTAVTFSGVVQDQHGNPQVNGGTVELYHKGHPGGYTDALDENGAFSLTVAAGSYDFLLDLDASSGSWAGTIDLSASKHQDLAVPMYALRVDVADSDGAPVSNAAVALIDGCNESSVELFPGFTAIGSYANARGSTNASGEITLTIPPCSSALTFQVTPAKGSGFAGTTFQIDNVTGNQTVDVVLPTAVTFSGVVQDQHGNPQVNGGTVELYHKGHPGGYTDALDENGAFSLTVAAGSYDFLLDLDASSGSWAGTIDLSASKHQDLAVPMYALRVDVADSDGAPVSNAAVALIDGCNESSVELFPGFTAIGSYANARGSTNASGEITLTIPPCSSALTFQVTPAKGSGFAGTTFQIDNVTGNQTVDVVLYSVYGNLSDGGNTPLADQTVSLTQPPAGIAASTARPTADRTVTNAHGFYGLTVRPGRYTLMVSGHSKPGTSLPTSYRVSVPNVRLTNGRVQNLVLPVTRIHVRVLDNSGTPVQGAIVSVPCTATRFPLFRGATATGRVCGAARTDANGLAAPAVLPAAKLALDVIPPTSDGACAATKTNLSAPHSGMVLVRLAECVSVSATGFTPADVSVVLGSMLNWNFVDGQVHRIVDETGLSLFDSGDRNRPATFAFTFNWSGVFGVTDRLTGEKGSIAVPLGARKVAGSHGKKFVVSWAADALPTGNVEEVQVRMPGLSTWADWTKASPGRLSATFRSEHAGKYKFRARLRSTSTDATSSWSPVLTLQTR